MNNSTVPLQKFLASIYIDAEAVEEICALFTPQRVVKKGCFALEGERCDRIGFVTEGLFNMHITKDDGSIFIKNFISAGDFLLAEFDPSKESSVTIEAVHPSRILSASWSKLVEVFAKYPEVESTVARSMRRRLERLYRRFEQFATLNAATRYRIFLEEFSHIESIIPQYLVAAYLGITPTQLSRIRKKSTAEVRSS